MWGTMTANEPLIAPELLSPSSIGTFRQCPLKFKFSKIDQLTEPPTDATALGNFVHEVLEDLYAMSREHRTMASARLIARDKWSTKWEAIVSDIIRSEKDRMNFRWSAWWCIENLWKLEDPQQIEPWGMEKHVTGEIGGVKVHGFIDRLMVDDSGRKVSVCDYKTGKTPKRLYVDDKFFQLVIYSQLISALDLSPESVSVELLYLKDGVRFEKSVTDDDIKEVTEVITGVRLGIEQRCAAGSFEPQTSILCNWCSFKSICPAWT